MFEVNRRKVVAMISAVGISAAGLLYLYAEQLDTEYESLVADQVEVVKAARNIPVGSALTKDRITTEKVPRKFLPPDPLLESELNIYLGTSVTTNVEEGAMLLVSDFRVDDLGRQAVARLASPLVIKTAEVALEAEEPAESGQAALAAVSKAGGYIVTSDIHVTTEMQSFTMTARIPAEKFEEVLFGFNEIGVTVERRVRGAGVTADVQRLERKLGNQEFLVEGLQDASPETREVREKTIEIIAGERTGRHVERETITTEEGEAEREIARARHELEQIHQDLDELRADTALSTIDLRITQPVEPVAAPAVPTKAELLQQEFTESVDSVLHGLFASVRLFASLLPALIFSSPFVLGFAFWYRRRRNDSERAA